MGRKTVPFVDESSLLRMRLREALEDVDAEVSLMEEAADDDGAPTGISIEDLCRINRRRARLIGLLRSCGTGTDAPVILVARGTPAAERDGLPEAVLH